MAVTGLVYCDKMLSHDTGGHHPEQPARLTAIIKALGEAGLKLPRIAFERADREDLVRVHSGRHVDAVFEACASGNSYSSLDTPMCKASWDAALFAAGGAIAACRAVLDGAVDNAFCAIRPPGHHSEREAAMGFCLFNNVAIAARWLRDVAGKKRVAIFDWDVHHGNGTQHAFYDDPTVYYASIHQHPHYPGTGFPHERGADNTNLNIQMKAGYGPEEWLDALDNKVLPELKRFDPEALLISAGFDAHRLDPLGSQELEADTYAIMTRRVKTLAGGRVVSLLEGGYHLEALGESVAAHIRALREG